MSDLPQFVSDDPTEVTQELISAYEAMTGKTLYPGQVERLLIDLIAYRETLLRSAINDTARQNLVAFARAPMLDYLGELVGVARLAAQSARTTVRITFAESLVSTLVISAGTRVESASGIQFQTEAEQIVVAGSSSVDLSVLAVEPGANSNGLLPGQVNALVDDLGVDVESVANLVLSTTGSDEESDDRLRDRIRLAPESFSVAGSRLSYRHHAMRSHPDIVDVAVLSPAPGVVNLYPLTKTGLPSSSVMDTVSAACSDEKVRPLTETVDVLPPVECVYSISARLTLYHTADAATALALAQDAAAGFAIQRQAALGLDVVPSQIIAALSVAGVYQVELLSPAGLINVPDQGWAHCVDIDVELSGGANG